MPFSVGNLHFLQLFHVLSISKNLLSVWQFCEDNNLLFEFHSSFLCVNGSNTKTPLLHGNTKNGMYVLASALPSFPPQAHTGERASPFQWHLRLGHPSMSLVHRIISSFSLPVHAHPKSGLYSSCCRAKLHQLPYTASSSLSTSPLRLLFADVWGPAPVLSRDGFRYYLFLVDDYSRFAWLFPLKCKYDVLSVFTSFKHK